MKKFQLLACAFAATLFTLSFNACSDDPDMPEIPDVPEESSTTHFDIWVTVGEAEVWGQVMPFW